MFHKMLFVGIVLFVTGLGIMVHHFSSASDLLKKYQKVGFVSSDFHYENVEKSWGGDGLILYQVSFPSVPVPMQANQMSLQLSDAGMSLKLKNVHIQITEGLKQLYAENIERNLNQYRPYQDFFTHLLTSMAVMGLDEFQGDVIVTTVYNKDELMHFTIQMMQEKTSVIQMTGMIQIPLIGAHQFSDLWQGRIASAKVNLNDIFLNRYINYAKSRRISPSGLSQPDIFQTTGMLLIPVKECFK